MSYPLPLVAGETRLLQSPEARQKSALVVLQESAVLVLFGSGLSGSVPALAENVSVGGATTLTSQVSVALGSVVETNSCHPSAFFCPHTFTGTPLIVAVIRAIPTPLAVHATPEQLTAPALFEESEKLGCTPQRTKAY